MLGMMHTEQVTRQQGQRSKKLQHAFHVTVKYALRGVPEDEFIAYFPEGILSKEIVEVAYDAYCQCLHQARVFIDREFEEICEDSHIADKLQTLDVMCAQQGFVEHGASISSTHRQQGPQLARIATIKAKKEAIQYLKAIQEDIRVKNAQLQEQLETKKSEARQLKENLQGSGGALNTVGRIAREWTSMK